MQAGEIGQLHLQVHGLAGTAATFGLVELAAFAGRADVLMSQLVEQLKADQAADRSLLEQLSAALVDLDLALQDASRPVAKPLLPVPEENDDFKPVTARPPVVLLVDDDPDQVALLKLNLEAGGYCVEVAADYPAILQVVARRGNPDAIIMDMVFPEDPLAGAGFIQQLAVDLEQPVPPMVGLSSRQDLDARLAAYRAGARHYLTKPVNTEHLITLLDKAIGRVAQSPYRVMVVDDDPLVLEVQASVLRSAGMRVTALQNPGETLMQLHVTQPDVLLLDMHMPGIQGYELAAMVRDDPRYCQLPIIFLSAESDRDRQLFALQQGGDDFLVKPTLPQHLIELVSMRAARARQLTDAQARLQKTLYEREREHLALNQHAIVSIADRAGNITYVNDLFCDVSGYKRGELLGQNHRLLKSGQHPESLYKELWATISSGQVWFGEICNRRKDGSFYWVESTITPFMDAEGKPYQYVSIRTDITHVKAVQEELKASHDEINHARERLRRGQLFANIGTWEWNISDGALFWSERIAPLFGYPDGELETSYDNFLAAIHPEDRAKVVAAVDACLKGEAPYDLEHRVVWPDGTVRWVSERGAVERDDSGNPLRMTGVVQDVTHRVLAEERLRESEEELQVFRRMVEVADQAIRVSGSDGRIQYVNPAYRALLGYKEDELIGQDFAQVAAAPDEHPLVASILDELKKGKGWQGLIRLRRKDGSEFYSQSNIGGILDPATGKLLHSFNIFTDHSEELTRQQALQAAVQESERANQAKSEFLSSMSHELRTPMNAILGFAQMLEYDEALDADQQENVHEILKAGHHLLELINEVLDLARIESGRMTLSLEPVEVQAVMDECCSLIGPLAVKAGIQLLPVETTEAVVVADRTRFKQVLLNLLSNAVKYNRPGGTVQLLWQQSASRQCFELQVKDTGRGIAAEDLEVLFEPFHRLGAETSEVEGTGIGLTITRRIMDLMGGSIRVESQLGIGSSFMLQLPLLPAQDAALDDSLAPKALPDTHGSCSGQRVLYIEDNATNLRLVRSILARIPNLQLLEAHQAELGLELALAHHPDLILLDINMPGMDGYELLRVIRQHPELKHLPVIAVSANAMPKDIERGKQAGFVEYITKPIQVQSFIASVQHWLQP
ncbi:response regulator [Marinospirillum alkaliphilum]|uniref:response regulator n=1 Tax=Marinospirillum alkaliphilum TaxID=148454 RepID=UPI001C434E21|nr:response regulator [Marinospirillum alkaliphilum]